MEKDKLKLIVHNLELLVNALKTEVYSDPQSYLKGLKDPSITDYDEIFEDDDYSD